MPLDMVDTCLCMGAGITIAQGIGRIEPDTACFAFVGDSTFFASALTGIAHAVYNQANMTLILLDNSTTAMTGHQPHPGTGRTKMGEIVSKIHPETVLQGLGVSVIESVNPLCLQEAIDCVKKVSSLPGVKAIIFRSPCIALIKPGQPISLNKDTCINCKKCINDLSCPAISAGPSSVSIDETLCTGCGLWSQVCPVNALKGGQNNE